MQKIRTKLLTLSSIIFLAIIAVIVFCVLFCDGAQYSINQRHPIIVMLLSGAMVVGLLCLRKRIITRLEKVSAIHELMIVAALFLFIGFMMVCIVWQLRVHHACTWDPANIHDGVQQLIDDGSLSPYFNEFPFQASILLLLFWSVKVARFFSDSVSINQVAIALNSLFVVATVLFTFLSVRKLMGRAYGMLAMILMPVIMLPLLLYTPIFYTDTVSAAAVAACLFLIILIIKNKKFTVLHAIILALVSFFGFRIKATAAIIMIAFGLVLLLTVKKRSFSRKLLAPIAVFVAIILSGQAAWSYWCNKHLDPNYAIPMEHWVALGVMYYGGYNDDGFDGGAYHGAWTNEAIKREAKSLTAQYLRNYGPIGYVGFLGKKISYTWGDGTYYVAEKLQRKPIKQDSELGKYIYGDRNDVFFLVLHAIKMASLLIFLVGAWQTIKTTNDAALSVMKIAFCGVFMFFCIWETRSRYLLNYLPMFVVLSFYFVSKMRFDLTRIKAIKIRNKKTGTKRESRPVRKIKS